MNSWEPLTRREMHAVDALLLRGDDDPAGRSTMLAIYVLDKTPPWERARETFERASRMVPRMRQRVMAPALPVSLPYWVGDPDFDLAYHLRRVRLPAGGTLRDLLDYAQVYASGPLDRGRPLWEAVLVEGLEPESVGGEAALLHKVSHAVSDGVGGLQMARALYEEAPGPATRPLPPAPSPDDVTPGDLVRLRLRQVPSDVVDAAVSVPRLLGSAAGVLRHPRSSVTRAVNFALSVRRVLSPPSAEPSPVLRRRGHRRRYSVLEVELRALRRASKAAGGSVNDGYLAALLGGVRRYHEKLGMPVDSIPVAVPINLRADDDPMSGNRFAGASFAGPVATADPAERIAQVRELVVAERAEPALDALSWLAPVLARAPAVVLGSLGGGASRMDLQASNVPGYATTTYFAGSQITRLYPFGPLPGVAAMVVMVSHAGTCYVGTHLDPDAVREPELFDQCLREGFDEVLALGDKDHAHG